MVTVKPSSQLPLSTQPEVLKLLWCLGKCSRLHGCDLTEVLTDSSVVVQVLRVNFCPNVCRGGGGLKEGKSTFSALNWKRFIPMGQTGSGWERERSASPSFTGPLVTSFISGLMPPPQKSYRGLERCCFALFLCIFKGCLTP